MDSIYVVILALTQVPVCFILMSRRTSELLTVQCYKRNPVWMTDHPEFQTHEIIGRFMLWTSYILSGVTLAAIINFTWITPTPDYYVSLLFVPQYIWLMVLFGYIVATYKWVMKKIPLSIRKASLTPRRLSSYLPVWIVYSGYGLNALIMGIYAWALMSGVIDNEILIRRLIGISGGMVIITFMLLVSLRRKQSNSDVYFGSSGRKVEVQLNVAILYLFVFVGVYRILGDFFEVSLFSTITLIVVMSIMIQTTFIVFSFHAKARAISREYRNRHKRVPAI